MSGEVVVVILAAGAGRRLGGAAKALLPLPLSPPLPALPARADAPAEATTFLAHIASTASAAGAGRAVVVVGPPHGERVAELAGGLGLDLAHNPDPDRGMGSSVAVGFAHALERYGGARAALLWPVDHVRVALTTVAWLVSEAAGGGAELVLVPTWRGRGGHPTAFGRALWPELAGCGALPRGARSVLEMRAERVRRVELRDPGITADVDRPGDR